MKTTRLDQLFKFLKERPDDEFLIFAIAKEYEGGGDDDTAKTYYLKLTDNHPDYVGTYYHLGTLYERAEDFEIASLTYETGMEIAKKAGDRHAYGELQGAYDMLNF